MIRSGSRSPTTRSAPVSRRLSVWNRHLDYRRPTSMAFRPMRWCWKPTIISPSTAAFSLSPNSSGSCTSRRRISPPDAVVLGLKTHVLFFFVKPSMLDRCPSGVRARLDALRLRVGIGCSHRLRVGRRPPMLCLRCGRRGERSPGPFELATFVWVEAICVCCRPPRVRRLPPWRLA